MPKSTQQAKASAPGNRDTPVYPMRYDVRIESLRMNGNTKGTASVSLNGQFAVREISVVQGPKGLFVSMPSRKNLKGEYHDVCFPCTKEARADFDKAVLTAYEQARAGMEPQTQRAAEPIPMRCDVRIHKLHPGVGGALKASASVNLNGQFAIRGVNVMNGSNGLFVSMPGFRGQNGMFKDYCFPCTKEARADFDKAVLTAYEQALSQNQTAGQNQSDGQGREAPSPFETGAQTAAPVMQM